MLTCYTLFDRGYMTVTPDHSIEVSSRIKQEFENGKEYYRLHGDEIRLPQMRDRRPSVDFLRWHNENVCKRPVELSITHKLRTDDSSQFDVG